MLGTKSGEQFAGHVVAALTLPVLPRRPLLPRLEEDARERMSLGGKEGSPILDDLRGRSDEKAAELVDVGSSTIVTVKAIEKIDPDIVNERQGTRTDTLPSNNGGKFGEAVEKAAERP